MKKLLMLGLMLVGAVAQAQGTELVSVPTAGGNVATAFAPHASDFWVQFNINAKLGRAWVEVNINPSINPTQRQRDLAMHLEGRWLVDGLSYDAASGKVMYNGTAVANVVPGVFGLGYRVENIASLKLSIDEKAYDDGFNAGYQEVETITLE